MGTQRYSGAATQQCSNAAVQRCKNTRQMTGGCIGVAVGGFLVSAGAAAAEGASAPAGVKCWVYLVVTCFVTASTPPSLMHIESSVWYLSMNSWSAVRMTSCLSMPLKHLTRARNAICSSDR